MNSSGAFALVAVEVMFSIGNNAGYCPVSFGSRLKASHGYQSARDNRVRELQTTGVYWIVHRRIVKLEGKNRQCPDELIS